MAGDSPGSSFTSVTTDIAGDTTVLSATGFGSVAGGGPVSDDELSFRFGKFEAISCCPVFNSI